MGFVVDHDLLQLIQVSKKSKAAPRLILARLTIAIHRDLIVFEK